MRSHQRRGVDYMNEMFAAVTDTAGDHLAYASAVVEHDGTLALSTVVASSPRNLFTYYFHNGGRRVTVDLWHITLEGVLHTRMNGTRRQWWVAPGPGYDRLPYREVRHQADLLATLDEDGLCCPAGQRCGGGLDRTGTDG